MSEEESSVAELLRSAAAQAEQAAPAFDAGRIVATAHRRRPWLAAGEALRRREVPYRPAIAFAILLAGVVVVATLVATHAFSSGASRLAGGTSTSVTLPFTTTTLPSGSTSVPPSTTAPPTTLPTSTFPVTTPPATTTPVTTTLPTATTTTVASTTTSVPTSTTSTTTPQQLFTAIYVNVTVTLFQIDYIDMGEVPGAKLVGTVSSFKTNDVAYQKLREGTIDVWVDPAFPEGDYVVSTSAQPGEPEGSWIFSLP
jgi:hypothetical protein